MKKKPLCLMCRESPVKKLTGESKDKQIYVNAEKVEIFCSKRCAANYGLLFNDVQSGDVEWDEKSEDWEYTGNNPH